MPIAERNGSKVFYEDTGSGDPPIVFVHGLGVHEHYAAQIQHFAKNHRVVAPDLPGFGRSDAPDRDYTIPAFAEDVAWLCDELELRNPVIAGHSMAGAVAMEVAATRPDLPSAIVLLDPTPIVPAPFFQDAMSGLVAGLQSPQYREVLRGFAENLMFRPTDDEDLREQIVDAMCAAPQRVVASSMAGLLAWAGEESAARVRVPVLLITAGEGVPSDMQRTREIVPNMELGRTVGAGHFAHLLVPEQVNAMIDRFLAVSAVATAAA